MTITINHQRCISCLRCLRACPSSVFHVSNQKVETGIVDNCIACGHCMDSCPQQAIQHSCFPPESVHAIDYQLLPSPEQILLLCQVRRSNRLMTKKTIDSRSLDLIAQAAHLAPTASNKQNVELTIISNPDTLKDISTFTLNVYTKIMKIATLPIIYFFVKKIMPDIEKYVGTLKRFTKELEQGNDLILRNATSLLFIHAPKNSTFGAENCNLAYQNASLMAESLGVSQIYTGFILTAIHLKKGKLERKLGIKGKIYAGMAMGIPEIRYPNFVDRKKIIINKI